MRTAAMSVWCCLFVLSLVSAESLVSLDCSALTGANLQDYTATGLSVYEKGYRACIVETSSGECIALFEGNGKDHSTISRILTFDIATEQYEEYWRKVPGDVAFAMATEYDFGQHRNISACSVETGSYILDASGFVGCSDVKEFLEDEYDDSYAFDTTVIFTAVLYLCIAFLAITLFFVSRICCSKWL
ncbi:unnamed protein product [Ectocarpus sp. 6 AP-2014]